MLVAHPSADLYGSDLQLVESVRGLVDAGRPVTVVLPAPGPLVERLVAAGAAVDHLSVPVLRKALLRPRGLVELVTTAARSLPRAVRLLRSTRPVIVYVNTVTIPLWLLAARIARVPVLCHVHEAEDDAPWLLRMALAAPLLLARTLVVNSNAARQSLVSVLPALARRAHVVHNGVGGPPDEVPPAPASPVSRVTLVGRLAPRKGTDVAVEAIALLRREGRQVDLELCGTVFPGYEWFEKDLRSRSEQPDLSGAVHFAGYTSPTWPALARAAVVVVPSRAEPFGNTAVEAQLAGRPVVASAVQGLQEIVTSGTTGLLVPPGDPAALAAAIATVLDDPDLAARLARGGQRNAVREFSLDRYRAEMAAAVDRTATR